MKLIRRDNGTPLALFAMIGGEDLQGNVVMVNPDRVIDATIDLQKKKVTLRYDAGGDGACLVVVDLAFFQRRFSTDWVDKSYGHP